MSTSPGVSEFVSDAFDSTAIDQEDLKKEMEQLVLNKKDSAPTPDGPSITYTLTLFFFSFPLFLSCIKFCRNRCFSSPHTDEASEWEKELQQELQEYEVVTESDNKDEQWDQEIEKMLQADES